MTELKKLLLWNVYFYIMASLWGNDFDIDHYLIEKLFVDNLEAIPLLILITVLYIGMEQIYKEVKPAIDKLKEKRKVNKVEA